MLTHGPVRVVADAAEWMLENGAEVARVQEATGQLALVLGMSDCECFALPTGVVLTLVDGAGFTSTVVRRISRRSVHVERLTRLEAVVRQARSQGWALGEVWLRLREAASGPRWHATVAIAASGLASGGFALFFDGNLAEGAGAFAIGAAWSALRRWVDRSWIPPVFFTTVGSFFVVAASQALALVAPVSATSMATGALMLLVPGLALVNTLQDLVAGELVSSQSRLAEVLLTGAGVAVGASAALALRGL